MRNLLRFLAKYHAVFLFVFLEVLSITMIVKYNNYQRVKFLNSSNQLTGSIYDGYWGIAQYFSLKQLNDELAEENAKLRSELMREELSKIGNDAPQQDSLYQQNFFFLTAKVINNSVNRVHNYILLNKGSRHGIKPDMGVVSSNGVVGVVTNVSKNYCTVISLLNNRLKISAKIKRNNYFGSLTWNGDDYRKAELDEIPFHVDVAKGDTIVTSGYSAIFPEGLMLGTVSDYSLQGGSNFYKITVDLSVDFKNLVYVDVIQNKTRDEILKLESTDENDQ
ncbi:rod shape-determining protein MreC [Prolixibacter denitrificans]|jgi:rod shape-determining protein MreC|uniref:Cell shape-determining protein MreC n=2 Tax=Prolixibacter denitrificans TaxID=1541063 RepID=A0A2P8C995_9BACT|nr:rod shape-determining protein MreC [Prolixibacter denitrificans]PSK81523.1 rod shape-determining protein MreC [Prolixibacter denitrificans]